MSTKLDAQSSATVSAPRKEHHSSSRASQSPDQRDLRGQRHAPEGLKSHLWGIPQQQPLQHLMSPVFVKQTHPLGLTPFDPGRSMMNQRLLPPIRNFARLASHQVTVTFDPEDELATFCLCKAEARVIDADNGRYIQCYRRNVGGP